MNGYAPFFGVVLCVLGIFERICSVFLCRFSAYCTKFWVDFAVWTEWVCSVFSKNYWNCYHTNGNMLINPTKKGCNSA